LAVEQKKTKNAWVQATLKTMKALEKSKEWRPPSMESDVRKTNKYGAVPKELVKWKGGEGQGKAQEGFEKKGREVRTK